MKKSSKRSKKNKKVYVWAIAYIHKELLSRIGYDLEQYGYDELGIECYVPTVKMLKKTFKGKNQYEFIPLLFNYGFFKLPFEKACNPEFLSQFKQRINAIYGWVKDPANTIRISPNLNKDNSGYHKTLKVSDFANETELSNHIRKSVKCAVAGIGEIESMKKSEDLFSIFNEDDLNKLSVGDYITLKGYPFDGIPAEIKEINYKKSYIKVLLDIGSQMNEVKVSFENIIYTVYSGYDENHRKEDVTIEDLGSYPSKVVDKIMFKIHETY